MQVVHTAIVNYNKQNTAEQREQGNNFWIGNMIIVESRLPNWYTFHGKISYGLLAELVPDSLSFTLFDHFILQFPNCFPILILIDLSEVQVLLLALQVFLTFFTKEIFTANLYYFNLHKASWHSQADIDEEIFPEFYRYFLLCNFKEKKQREIM